VKKFPPANIPNKTLVDNYTQSPPVYFFAVTLSNKNLHVRGERKKKEKTLSEIFGENKLPRKIFFQIAGN
jgi:hypothetical protein